MLSGSEWSTPSYNTYLPGFLVLRFWGHTSLWLESVWVLVWGQPEYSAAGQSIFSKNVMDPDKSDDKDAPWGCREPRVAFFILKKILYQAYTRGRGTENRVINQTAVLLTYRVSI